MSRTAPVQTQREAHLPQIVESERLFYKDNRSWIFNGDARNMWELPNECVQMVCTSPPYWGLRKYEGQQELIWGGDKDCEHRWHEYKRPNGGGHPTESAQVGAAKADVQRIYDYRAGFCSLCGAWKGAFGLEPTPDCGRPLMRLREDLTDKEKRFVMDELKRVGLI